MIETPDETRVVELFRQSLMQVWRALYRWSITAIGNLRVGKEWANVGLHLDVLNLLDSDDHDIDYFHASRLAGEPDEGVEDIHFRPLEPRALRLSLSWKF